MTFCHAMLCCAVLCCAVSGGDAAAAAYQSALVAELSKSGSMPLSTLASKVGRSNMVLNTLLLIIHCMLPRLTQCLSRLLLACTVGCYEFWWGRSAEAASLECSGA